MSDLEKQQIPVPCRSCGKTANTTVYNLFSSRKVKCTSCGSEVEITSSDASAIKNTINNIEKTGKRMEEELEKARKLFNESIAKAFDKATYHIKKK